VLENYLIDEVAGHLHDLLHRALKWNEEVNAELRERPCRPPVGAKRQVPPRSTVKVWVGKGSRDHAR
jgi:hypothetical protein